MEPFLTTAFRGCQFDDTYSLQRQYADELETHSGLRNNDTAGNATPVTLVTGVTSTWRWLSNDDSSDVDYIRISGLAGQSLTVQVIPSDPISPADPNVDTYLEGAQNADGTCSDGNDFDPTTRQDLTLELLAANGSSVLADSTSAPAGETESINSFPLPSDGAYFLRINGGSADRAQLYELEVLVEDAPPAPRIQVDATRILAESNSGANGVADPRETVQFGVTLSNQGNLAANNLVANITGPSGFTGFETSDTSSSLAPSASTELLFLFAQDGQCGDTIELTVTLTADGGYSQSLAIPLELGTIGAAGLLDEGFDGASALPAGWSQSLIGGGSAWVTSTARADSPSRSAFSAGVSSAGEALLVSPSVMVGSSGATLSFRHYYDLQSKVDGAVLEASLDGGDWFDLLNSAATVVSGDYNDSIRGNVNTPLRLNEVWTGASGGFVTTAVDLPATWGDQQVQFRWRLVHDSGTAGEGWYLDTVSYVSGVPVCDPFNPVVSLTASGTTLVENDPAATVTLTLSTPLPLDSN
ncbi:MAG: choice-of-anchor J domain-containing protein, partial [Verrucomicrobiales bacterium]